MGEQDAGFGSPPDPFLEAPRAQPTVTVPLRVVRAWTQATASWTFLERRAASPDR
jgi:hypothetical protein